MNTLIVVDKYKDISKCIHSVIAQNRFDVDTEPLFTSRRVHCDNDTYYFVVKSELPHKILGMVFDSYELLCDVTYEQMQCIKTRIRPSRGNYG